MIKEITITNFYSFEQETIKINLDTNILVGINGSGKSNFFKVIRLLKEGVAGIGLKKQLIEHLGGFDNFFFKGAKKTKNRSIIITFRIDGIKIGLPMQSDLHYQITITEVSSHANYSIKEKITAETGFVYLDFSNGVGYLAEKMESNGKKGNHLKPKLVKYADYDPQELVLREISDSNRYFILTALKKAIRAIVVYDYFDTTPQSGIRRPILPTSEKRLITDGANLAQMLNTIKINHKIQYREIVEMLQEVNPHFTGFDFNLVGGNIELMLEEARLNSSIHVSNISDGTLRYLCLLAILYNPDRGNFICIDEPEVGLHPDMILNIANAIKKTSTISTLAISTHSENLLNHFDLEHIRVFEKDDNNATHVCTYSDEQFADWYEHFSVGNMWRKGDLGGVRYGS
jgi:predicted ATPase